MSNQHSSPSRVVGRFMRDRRGNVALTFALAVLPVVGCVGAAVDYSRANAAQTALQSALDSTALMLSKKAATDTSAQLQADAENYFSAVFKANDASNVRINVSYNKAAGNVVTVTGSATVPTTFVGLLGYDTLGISGSSTAKWGSTRLRVALVLDNTGSMAEYGKLTALKSATTNLLAQLQTAAQVNGDVYVSIVPFVKDVNVGGGNYNSEWIYWGTPQQDPARTDDTSWDANNGTCSVSFSPWGYRSPRAACLAGGGTWTPKNHDAWNGCVMDRGYPQAPSTVTGKSGPDTMDNYDTNVGAIDTQAPSRSSMYAAEQYPYCPSAAAMSLSYDWPAMNALVTDMTANGNTNQAIGLQLGWMSLVGGGPFTAPVMDPNYQYQQIIILLTRRPQHPGPLVRQSGLHRRAAAVDLQQRQGGRDHALYNSGEHRWRPDLGLAAKLRQFVGQVLPVDVGEPDRLDL